MDYVVIGVTGIAVLIALAALWVAREAAAAAHDTADFLEETLELKLEKDALSVEASDVGFACENDDGTLTITNVGQGVARSVSYTADVNDETFEGACGDIHGGGDFTIDGSKEFEDFVSKSFRRIRNLSEFQDTQLSSVKPFPYSVRIVWSTPLGSDRHQVLENPGPQHEAEPLP